MITTNSLEHNITNSTGRGTFYLTTAIAYMNGDPHIGHAYEVITSDAIVRLHRLLGYDTYFVTGADEHGQKVEKSALAAGVDPKEFLLKTHDAYELSKYQFAYFPHHQLQILSGLNLLWKFGFPKDPLLLERSVQ